MSKKTKPVTAEYGETVVYLGPTLRGVAAHGTAFKGELPESLKKAAEKEPLLSKLILNISDFAEAQKSIVRKSGKYYDIYKTVEKGR